MFKAALSFFVLLTAALLISSRGASTQTRLPERIVHPESGITLVLVPAGRFRWLRSRLPRVSCGNES